MKDKVLIKNQLTIRMIPTDLPTAHFEENENESCSIVTGADLKKDASQQFTTQNKGKYCFF